MNTTVTRRLKSRLIFAIQNTKNSQLLDEIDQVFHFGNYEKEFYTKLHRHGFSKSQIISSIKELKCSNGSFRQKKEFIAQLKANTVLNIDILLRKEAQFKHIFSTEFAAIMFKNLANIGKGAKLRGPGEYALVGFSTDISFAPGPGDIVIDGKKIEVKAANGKHGGRMGDSSIAPLKREILEIITNHNLKFAKHLESVKSLSIIPFLKCAIQYMTLLELSRLITDMVDLTFPGHGKVIGKQVLTGKHDLVELEYIRQNFIWYKNICNFDSMLVLALNYNITFNIQDADQLFNMRRDCRLGSPSVSLWPSKPHEVHAQLNFTQHT